MNKILNYIRVILTIIIGASIFFFTLANAQGILEILIALLCIFWVGTTIIDIIKKNNFTNKHNIIYIIISLILIFIIFKPFIDATFFTNFGGEFILSNVSVLFFENRIYIWIVTICLFILNYVDYKLK